MGTHLFGSPLYYAPVFLPAFRSHLTDHEMAALEKISFQNN